MDEGEVFGRRVRRRRMALGWSQATLAKRMAVLPAEISRYEGNVYAGMTFARLRLLAQTLATSTDYLLGLSNDPGPVPDLGCPGQGIEREGKVPALYINPLQERINSEEYTSAPP
jgi:transcriptional regulator with XRE-family HTH domain